jgi:hypothetical protein
MHEALYRDCHTHNYCNITSLLVEWASRNMPQSLTTRRKRTPGHSLPPSNSVLQKRPLFSICPSDAIDLRNAIQQNSKPYPYRSGSGTST